MLADKTEIATYISIIVGIATILTSIATIIVAVRQNRISEKQNEIQDMINQPIFEIRHYQKEDKDDGLYGTDILDVNNIGHQFISCDINVSTFFCLSKQCFSNRDSVCIKIDDYFFVSTRDNGNPNNIKRFYCEGNNRIFNMGYRECLENGITDNRDTFYFYDKIILVEITYMDVFRKMHTLYFKDGNEIDDKNFQSYFEESSKYSYANINSLNKVNYQTIKGILDSKGAGKQ